MSSDQVGFDAQKSWFQRYLFDFTRWSHLFQTTTQEIKDKLADSFWPLRPENQPHYMNNSNASKPRKDELYGPLWILVTLVVEFLILGNVANLLTIELGENNANKGTNPPTLLNMNSNDSLRKIVTMSFALTSFFLLVPFILYMVFRSRCPPSAEISFMRFFSVYAYSMAVFIPVTALYTVIDFNRVRWLLLASGFALASYYQLKETIEVGMKYLDFDTFRRTACFVLASTLMFCLLLKFYFIGI